MKSSKARCSSSPVTPTPRAPMPITSFCLISELRGFGFLAENFHTDPKQLVAVGFGEEKLKNSENPLAAENRRVQVVNMANKDVAAKAAAPSRRPAGREAAAVIW